uniref:Hexosyltransferase n=1 Tax=Steinernema glaseri TaxID=37863 RepID=A0A1I7Z4B1_9BILA
MARVSSLRRRCAACSLVLSFLLVTAFYYSNVSTQGSRVANYVKLIDSNLLSRVKPTVRNQILSVAREIAVAPKAVPLVEHNPVNVVGTTTGNSVDIEGIPEINDDHLAFQFAVQKIKEGSSNASTHFEPFPYLVEPKVCSDDRPVPPIIFYVTVPPGPDDIVTRALIRNTWAQDARARGFGVVFTMGRHSVAVEHNHTSDVQVAMSENALYGDIMMANFRDSWEHLIHKWWATTHFHALHCRDVPLMALTDSDTVVFAENFDRFLTKNAHRFEDKIGCTSIGGQPAERGELSRYYISRKLWPSNTLPPYCSGTMQIYSSNTAQRLTKGVLELGIEYVTSFKIFDVVTGPVAKIAGVEISHVQEIRSWLPTMDVCQSDVIAQHGIKPATVIPIFLDYRKRCCAAAVDNICPYNGTMPEKIAVQTRAPPVTGRTLRTLRPVRTLKPVPG